MSKDTKFTYISCRWKWRDIVTQLLNWLMKRWWKWNWFAGECGSSCQPEGGHLLWQQEEGSRSSAHLNGHRWVHWWNQWKLNLSYHVWSHKGTTFFGTKIMTQNGQNSRPAETDTYACHRVKSCIKSVTICIWEYSYWPQSAGGHVLITTVIVFQL